MSENIQSISQGTYTIGQTSATNFVAGTGIKIDEPSAGTVRIGNDETVLWSGSKYWWDSTAALNLSESVNNFEIIRIKAKDDWALREKYFYVPSNPSDNQFDITLDGFEGSKLVIKTSKYNFSGNQIELVGMFSLEINSSKAMNIYTDRSYIQFQEVIGINRISGSNT